MSMFIQKVVAGEEVEAEGEAIRQTLGGTRGLYALSVMALDCGLGTIVHLVEVTELRIVTGVMGLEKNMRNVHIVTERELVAFFAVRVGALLRIAVNAMEQEYLIVLLAMEKVEDGIHAYSVVGVETKRRPSLS
jgi:hypothetical protein